MVMGLTSDIKIKLGSEKDCVQPVTVEMANAKVVEHIEQAYKKVQAKVKMPGFRPGKTPMDLIKQRFQENAYAEAQESLLREGITEAIKQKNIRAIQTPMVSSVQFDPKKSFQFEFKVEVSPKFKLASYKGLKLTKKINKIQKKDIDDQLKRVAESQAQLAESKAETLQKSHHAVINYEAFIDGTPLKGSKTENFLMDLSAPQAIEGLVEGLDGMKVNEEKEIAVTFPKDSPSKDLAGQNAVFKVKLLAIKEKNVPELNDDFAKDLGLESLAKLTDQVQTDIQNERDLAAKRELTSQVIDQLVSANSFPLPPSLVDKQTEYLKSRQMDQMTQQGVKKEDMDKFFENIKIQIRQQAEREIKVQYILNEIAESEKINVTDEEISIKIKAMAAQYGSKDGDKIEKMIRERYTDSIRSDTRDGKTIEWIISNAKIKEVEGEAK